MVGFLLSAVRSFEPSAESRQKRQGVKRGDEWESGSRPKSWVTLRVTKL
jgi:hypothetical protein